MKPVSFLKTADPSSRAQESSAAMAACADARPAGTWGAWTGPVATALVALAVSFVYGLPQLLYFQDGRSQALLQSLDEVPYAARVHEVMDGHWRTSDQYLWEHKANPPILPYGAELTLGLLGRLLGLDVDALVIIVRLVAPALLALLLASFLQRLTQSRPWALVGAALILLEPGTYYYKPFLYVTAAAVGYPEPWQLNLPYTRFHNPLVLLIPFLLAVIALYRALLNGKRRDAHLAGLAIGINFYTQLFYWTYLYAGMMGVATVYWRNRARRSLILRIAVLGTVWGSFALIERLLASAAFPHGELLTRAGLFLQTRTPIHLFPKGLVAATLLFGVFHRPKDLPYAFLMSFLVGGYLLLNQNVVTGLEIQNYHFNYVNGVMAASALVVLAHGWASQIAIGWGRRERGLAFGVAAAAVVAWLFGNGVALQAKSYAARMRAEPSSDEGYPSNLRSGFERTLAWIRASTPRDAVFLANSHVSFLIPVYTGGNVFLNPLLGDHMGSFMSDDELFERWMIHLKLEGVTAEELFQRVRFSERMPIVGWGFGRNERLTGKYDFSQADAFSEAMRTNRLPLDYVREYESFPGAEIPERLARYRVDYVVVSRRDSRFAERALDYLSTWSRHAVGNVSEEGVEIYRVAPPPMTRGTAR